MNHEMKSPSDEKRAAESRLAREMRETREVLRRTIDVLDKCTYVATGLEAERDALRLELEAVRKRAEMLEAERDSALDDIVKLRGMR